MWSKIGDSVCKGMEELQMPRTDRPPVTWTLAGGADYIGCVWQMGCTANEGPCMLNNLRLESHWRRYIRQSPTHALERK